MTERMAPNDTSNPQMYFMPQAPSELIELHHPLLGNMVLTTRPVRVVQLWFTELVIEMSLQCHEISVFVTPIIRLLFIYLWLPM